MTVEHELDAADSNVSLKAGEDMMARIGAIVVRVLLLAPVLLGTGCAMGAPEWRLLYERKLGQPIRSVNEAALNSAFLDAHGNLTRVSWATLDNGSLALLGLPSAQNPRLRIVERTIVLPQPEWQQLCQAAIGGRAQGWSWSTTEASVSNTFQVYPSRTSPTTGTDRAGLAEAGQAYCEFAFLPQGWVLRVIESKGVVKAAP